LGHVFILAVLDKLFVSEPLTPSASFTVKATLPPLLFSNIKPNGWIGGGYVKMFVFFVLLLVSTIPVSSEEGVAEGEGSVLFFIV